MHTLYRARAQVAEDGTVVVSNVPFPAGEAVEVTVRLDAATGEGEVAAKAGDAMAVLERLAGTIEGPEDSADEHDHYLYGTPKRNDRKP